MASSENMIMEPQKINSFMERKFLPNTLSITSESFLSKLTFSEEKKTQLFRTKISNFWLSILIKTTWRFTLLRTMLIWIMLGAYMQRKIFTIKLWIYWRTKNWLPKKKIAKILKLKTRVLKVDDKFLTLMSEHNKFPRA